MIVMCEPSCKRLLFTLLKYQVEIQKHAYRRHEVGSHERENSEASVALPMHRAICSSKSVLIPPIGGYCLVSSFSNPLELEMRIHSTGLPL